MTHLTVPGIPNKRSASTMKKASSILQIVSGAALIAAGVLGIIEACTRARGRERRVRGIKL